MSRQLKPTLRGLAKFDEKRTKAPLSIEIIEPGCVQSLELFTPKLSAFGVVHIQNPQIGLAPPLPSEVLQCTLR